MKNEPKEKNIWETEFKNFKDFGNNQQ